MEKKVRRWVSGKTHILTLTDMTKRKRRGLWFGMGMISLLGLTWAAKDRWLGSLPVGSAAPGAPSPDATWPLANARTRTLARGVTQTTARAPDGTEIDLFAFDFSLNPRLRWEIFDQDEDDPKPFDNRTNYWNRNVAQATKQLGAQGRGNIMVAWNGSFFGYLPQTNRAAAFHVSPVVLRGKVHFNTANHRWAWGVKQGSDGPQWKVFHQPSRAVLEREFDYAAGALQCLVQEGKPLQLEPQPARVEDIKAQPVSSTKREAGHIPVFDHMRTCRASIAWSRDNRQLFFLSVKEPDSEAASAAAWKQNLRAINATTGLSLGGGWTVADVQRFWLKKGVWGAVNSDAGDVLQWVARTPKGYEMMPPRQGSARGRLQCAPNWNGAVAGGGAQMYFLVRETPIGNVSLETPRPNATRKP